MPRPPLRLQVLVATLLAVAAGLWLGFPSLDGYLLSDDLLLPGALRGTGPDRLGVDWSRVAADWVGPWLGFDNAFWRPLLSVTFGFDLARADGGTAATELHQTNLVIHLVTVATSAWLCALHAGHGRRALAALFGGLLVALHPIVIEPVAWIAARNSGLEVMLRTLALLCFAQALRKRRPGAWKAGTWTFAILALAAKESAIVLPLGFLALDLLQRPHRPLRQRLRMHAPFVPLWLGWFLWRRVILGTFVGGGGASGQAEAGDLASNALAKIAAIATPSLSFGADWPQVLGAAVTGGLLLVVCGAAVLRGRFAFLIGLLWVTLHTVPTFALRMNAELSGSRMVFGALPAIALTLVAAGLRGGRPAAWTWRRGLVGLLVAAAPLWVLVDLSRQRLHSYETAWDQLRAARRALADVAADLPPDQMLALTSMPIHPAGSPPFNPNGWFALAERPFQDRDVPVVSLGFLVVEVPRGEELFHDAGPLRVLHRSGVPILGWDESSGTFRVLAPADDAALERRIAQGTAAGRYPAQLPAALVDELEFRSTTSPGGGRVRWLSAVPEEQIPEPLRGLEFGPSTRIDDGFRTTLDLTRALGPATLATLGIPLQGFAVELTDAALPDALVARSVPPRLAPLVADSDGPLEASLDALLDRLHLPDAGIPAAAECRLVLLGPHSALPIPFTPGQPLAIPTPIAKEVDDVLRLSRGGRFALYAEARLPQGRARVLRTPLLQLRLSRATD